MASAFLLSGVQSKAGRTWTLAEGKTSRSIVGTFGTRRYNSRRDFHLFFDGQTPFREAGLCLPG